jgi:hypothetical protein
MKLKSNMATNPIVILNIKLFKLELLRFWLFSIIFILGESAYAQGCSIILKITDPSPVCASSTVNLTSEAITKGSTSGLVFSYYLNAELTIPVPSPTQVNAGVYYVKGDLLGRCNGFAIATVNITSIKPKLIISIPVVKNVSGSVDLTSSVITSGSDSGLVFSYWFDEKATTQVPHPRKVGNGVYFIKGTSDNGCFDIQSITVND